MSNPSLTKIGLVGSSDIGTISLRSLGLVGSSEVPTIRLRTIGISGSSDVQTLRLRNISIVGSSPLSSGVSFSPLVYASSEMWIEGNRILVVRNRNN